MPISVDWPQATPDPGQGHFSYQAGADGWEQHDQMREGLLHLTDEQIASCLNLCAFASGYIAINACGRQWPDEDNLRRIAEPTTTSNNARAFGLKAEEVLSTLSRRWSSTHEVAGRGAFMALLTSVTACWSTLCLPA